MPKVIDTRARFTDPDIDRDTFNLRDQSGASSGSLHYPRDLNKSLAASDQTASRPNELSSERGQKRLDSHIFLQGSSAIFNEALSLQKEVVEIVVGRFEEVSGYVQSNTCYYMQVDVHYFGSVATEQELIVQREQARLKDQLHYAFEAEPLEDGMYHQAEKIIRQALQSGEEWRVFEWLSDFSLDNEQPVFAASVLRCLGRQSSPGMRSWRTGLVSSALDMDDAEIRDAAVQAAEFWGGKDIRNVLEAHIEPLPWLRDYVRNVVEDLGD